jgi:hypothetical protein
VAIAQTIGIEMPSDFPTVPYNAVAGRLGGRYQSQNPVVWGNMQGVGTRSPLGSERLRGLTSGSRHLSSALPRRLTMSGKRKRKTFSPFS